MVAWRAAGINYVRFSQIAAEVGRFSNLLVFLLHNNRVYLVF